MMTVDGFAPGRWFRVLTPEGRIWCETSVEKEARAAVLPGYTLQRLYERQERKWVNLPDER